MTSPERPDRESSDMALAIKLPELPTLLLTVIVAEPDKERAKAALAQIDTWGQSCARSAVRADREARSVSCKECLHWAPFVNSEYSNTRHRRILVGTCDSQEAKMKARQWSKPGGFLTDMDFGCVCFSEKT
jgi:hypothetical protein